MTAAEDAETQTGHAPPAVHSRTVALAWVAIAFGVLSLPGALYLLPLPEASPWHGLALTVRGIAPATAIISWLLALIAALVSGARLIRAPRTRNSKMALALAAPGAVAGTIALAVVFYFIASVLGLTQPNEAERSGERAVQHYLDQGASLICDSGDSGHGPNRYPWYEAYLEVPAALGTEQQARDAVTAAGYTGARRSSVPGSYDLPVEASAFQVESLAEQIPDFDGDRVSPLATVEVLPWGRVSGSCSVANGSWGDGTDQGDGTVLIAIRIRLDSTR